MDLKQNSAEQSNTSTLVSKREQLRTTLRKQELDIQFQQKRKQLHIQEEELQQKQANLKFEEMVLNFNKLTQDAYEYILLKELHLAVSSFEVLLNQLKLSPFKNFKSAKELDSESFEETLKEIERMYQESPDNIYLLFLQDQIDDICSLLSEDDDDGSVPTPIDYQIKCLQIMQQQQVKNCLSFLKKYFRNSPLWFQAVLRQRFNQIDDELLDLVIKCLPQQDAWLILIPLQNIPYREQLVQLAWQYKSTEYGIQFIKKSLSNESYLKRFLHMNLFNGLGQCFQQCENKQFMSNQILDIILSVCCIKMELFDKIINTGLIQMISSCKINDFNYDGYHHLYRIAYWLKTHNSNLFQVNLKEELWFQNIIRILIQQQTNLMIQQSACDLLKEYLSLPEGEKFKMVLKNEIIPDYISSQINQLIL